jgi:hypothetical protein
VSKRLLVIPLLVALAVLAGTAETYAQVRRFPRRVVVVNAFAAPFWYYDPWYGFYGDQWGVYPPYGPYRRYNLEPESSVRLEVKPKQAEVYVDGYYAGIVDDFNGTFQRLHLPAGEHEILLYLDGFRAVHQKVYLTPDNTFKLKYEMEKLARGEQPEPRPKPTTPPPQAGPPPQPYPAPPPRTPAGRRAPPPQMPREPRGAETSAYGTLAIRVQPADAEILVDGERWRGPESQDRMMIEVAEGRHTIEIQKSGYRSYITEIDVRRGETTPLNVSLRSQEEQ